MKKIFVIDIARCSGCYNCQLACKDEHCGNDWRPYAAPQPPTGMFWCRVKEFSHGSIPKLRLHYEPLLCGHCDKPVCLGACPQGAIDKRDDGLVIINPDTCVGCGICQQACPHGAISFNAMTSTAQKCTGCAHLLDHGAKLPRCVEACPTGAMRFGDISEFDEKELEKATRRGNVYYLNIPGRFIAGTVYDPIEEEVVIGAKCTLRGAQGGGAVQTDDFGDFWFENLPEDARYTLDISAEGFKSLHFEGLSTEKDINLGDLPMEKA